MSFFQSPIRKHIKTIIYGEESFSITLFDQEYFGIKKSKSLWPVSISRYQVLGVQLPTNNMPWVADQVAKVYRDYHTHRSHISFQWGIVNEILQFPNHTSTSDDFLKGMRPGRKALEHKLQQETALVPSFRENMPLSTIIIDVTKTDEALLQDMSSETKTHIRKSSNHGMEFCIADASDYENFYEEWITVAGLKWFNTISKSTYLKLMDYLSNNQCGAIFMVKKDGIILGGSIMVYDDTTITYLYGFSNRSPQYRNMGVHKFIKYKVCGRAREHGLQELDLFGWSPTGFPEHSLASVSKFKESLWGKKIERYGNYDIILNPYLYKAFERHHKRKKS